MMRAKLVAAGETRNSAAGAMSAGVPNRPHGMFFMSAVSKSEVSGDVPLSTLM